MKGHHGCISIPECKKRQDSNEAQSITHPHPRQFLLRVINKNHGILFGMSLDDAKNRIQQKLSLAGRLNARVKFDFGDEGQIFIDATQTPPVMQEQGEEADVTLLCTLDTFTGFLNGSQNPSLAFMMGKLRVKGSMGLAMKLNAILED